MLITSRRIFFLAAACFALHSGAAATVVTNQPDQERHIPEEQ
jgi:hypothetical protein